MKELTFSLLFIVLLSLLCYGQQENHLDGVWKMEKKIVPKGKKMVNLFEQDPGFTSYKFVNGTRFIVCAAGENGQLYYSHCGRCVLDGNTLYESIELSNNKNLINVTNQMNSRFENGKWIVESGSVMEVWIRVENQETQKEEGT